MKGAVVVVAALGTMLAPVVLLDRAGEASDDSLPYRVVVPGVQREVDDAPTPTPDPYEAIYRQLPAEFPARTETGWPMHALTGGITWARIGETERATAWADEFWSLRDAESGLWVSEVGYIDMVNPYLATVLFDLLGMDERAVETSAKVIAWSRAHDWGGYNPHFFAGLTAVVIGETYPPDIWEKILPAFEGRYGALEEMQEPTAKGRYFADIMLAHWRAWGGGDGQAFLSDETEYCPTLAASAECEGFYRWARGDAYVPDLGGEPYGFYNDGVIFYSIPGLERVR